jgi:6-phosphogluconolactonase
MRRLLWLLLFPVPALAATISGWIGTYTTNSQVTGSEGIYSFRWSPEAGDLGGLAVAAKTSNPSFMAVHPNGRYLYAVNEDATPSNMDHIDQVSAFRIDRSSSASLVSLGSVSSHGSAPCYLSVDATGRWLFVANYYSGNIAVYPIHADGRLGEATQIIQQVGSGPAAGRQDSAHAHEVVQTPDGRFLLAVDLGADKIFIYRFDARSGRLSPNSPAFAGIPAGYGPRHLLFSKEAPLVYVVTELNPSVITLRWDAKLGSLTQLAVTPTLPEGFTGKKSGAEIALHPSGRFLYASNRGDANTIAIFRIGPDGIPRLTGQQPSGGTSPRFFTIDPTGRFLIAAHQASGDLYVFRIDPATGALQRQSGRIAVPAPVMVLFDTQSDQ